MIAGIHLQPVNEPLEHETIILANLAWPEDVQAYIMLMSFMIMTHNQVVLGQADLIQDILDWGHFPLCTMDDHILPASLTLTTLLEIANSPILRRLLTYSHTLFVYPGKPESDEELAGVALEQEMAIKRVAMRIHLLFNNATLFS